MRAGRFLALLTVGVLASCGGGDDGSGQDSITPEGPRATAPHAPTQNDPAFAITGAKHWYLIGNAATPGDDTLRVHIVAPTGTRLVDAWIGDEPGVRLDDDGAGGFDLAAPLAAVPAGTYPVVFAADGAPTAFAAIEVHRSAPYYILVSTDWDFSDPGDAMFARQDLFHADHPELRITHFVGPYTFTDPEVTADRQAAIAAWLLAQQADHHDEIGLHIHPYCHFVESAGVACVTDQSTVYPTDTTGYTIKLEAYGHDNMVTLMNHAIALFTAHGLPRPRSFCGGGWTTVLDTLKAAEDTGFTTEASAFNWSRIEEWKGVGTGELYRWLMSHWAPIGDTSQPYYPSQTDILAATGPHSSVLEVPHNGLTVDYVDPAEVTYLFSAQWHEQPLATPKTLQVGYHPSADWPSGWTVRVEELLTLVDGHLASQDLGPVVYTTMSDVVAAFPHP